MRSFLLLIIITLVAGCEAARELSGCRDGWISYTYKCNTKCGKDVNQVEICKKNTEGRYCYTLIGTDKMDTWYSKDRISLFYDTNSWNITVAIKKLKKTDKGKYDCVFVTGRKPKTHTFKLEVHDDDGCQKAIHYTASTSAQTTFTCSNPTDDFEAKVRFFCKERDSDCEEIVSTASLSNGSFTMTETDNRFKMTIKATMSQHTGVYWCGVRSDGYRAGLKKIQLRIQGPPAASTAASTPSIMSTATRLTVATPPVPADKNGKGSLRTSVITVIVCVALLVLVFVLALVCKWFMLSQKRTKEAEQNNKEDSAYEEIQECTQNPKSVLRTIYVTANHPANIPAFMQNSNVNSQVSSDQATNSAVKVNQSHIYSTVNHPSQPSQDPVYSMVT